MNPSGPEPFLPLRANGYVGAGRYLLQQHLGDGGRWHHHGLGFLLQWSNGWRNGGRGDRFRGIGHAVARAEFLQRAHLAGAHATSAHDEAADGAGVGGLGG